MMSSCFDSGYYADKASKDKESECEKSNTLKHEWIRKGISPSHWDECEHCGKTLYYK
jgi:hypothetical protein